MCCVTVEIVKDALLTTCLGIYFKNLYRKIRIMTNVSKHCAKIDDDTIIIVSNKEANKYKRVN